MCVTRIVIRISIVENASGKEAMLSETAFIAHIKSKVCTSVSFESSFQVQPFGLHVYRKG
jgi:hypothetical protein